METGTEIMLQRMKDYPEEFVADRVTLGMSKWERLIGEARDYLPKEDIEALDAGYRQARIDLYNERVLRTLAGESGNVEESYPTIKASKQYAGGFTDARALIGGGFAQAQVKQEGSFVGTLQDHAAQHQQMVLEREEQIQRDMQNAVRAQNSCGTGLGQNSTLGGWFSK